MTFATHSVLAAPSDDRRGKPVAQDADWIEVEAVGAHRSHVIDVTGLGSTFGLVMVLFRSAPAERAALMSPEIHVVLRDLRTRSARVA